MTYSMKPRHSYTWLWPLLTCFFGYVAIHKGLDRFIHFDAEHVYLPAARAFLEQGWDYLLTKDSYRVVPLAYLWPALWGAEPYWIRIANAGLWTGIVYFMWQTSTSMAGVRAGLVAMLLLVLHPDFIGYFSTELTEPIFLFGLFGLIHQLSRACIEGKINATTACTGALMLTITLLSRPVLQLLAPALLLALLLAQFLFRFTHLPLDAKPLLRCISWMLFLGLIIPSLLIVKNGVHFDLWGLGTGSGTGLYLGTHPLTQGSEPPFLGIAYDVNDLAMLVTHNGDHLSLDADRAARAAALQQIQSMSFSDGLSFYTRKIWWWLMHHPAQIESIHGNFRKYRIFEFITILSALALIVWRIRKRSPQALPVRPTLFAGLLLALFGAMLIQLIPILHNARYSSALLDPWLMLLSAFSVGLIIQGLAFEVHRQPKVWSLTLRSTTSVGATVACLAALLLLAPAAYNLAKRFEYPVAIDPAHMGSTRSLLDMASDDSVHTDGMAYLGNHQWRVTTYPASFHVRLPEHAMSILDQAKPYNAMWLTQVAIRAPRGRCDKTEISYLTEAGAVLQPAYKLPLRLNLNANGHVHPFVTHANGEMRPKTSGSYRIVFHCPADTLIEWRGTQLLESAHTSDMAQRLMHKNPLAP